MMGVGKHDYVLLSPKPDLAFKAPLLHKSLFVNDHEHWSNVLYYVILFGITIIMKIWFNESVLHWETSWGTKYIVILVEIALYLRFKKPIHKFFLPERVKTDEKVKLGLVHLSTGLLAWIFVLLLIAIAEYVDDTMTHIYSMIVLPLAVAIGFTSYRDLTKRYVKSRNFRGVFHLARDRNLAGLGHPDEDYFEGDMSDKRYLQITEPNYASRNTKYFTVFGKETSFAELKSLVSCMPKRAAKWFSTGYRMTSIYGDCRPHIMHSGDKNVFGAVFGRTFNAKILPQPKVAVDYGKFVRKDFEERLNKSLYPMIERPLESYLDSREKKIAVRYKTDYDAYIERAEADFTLAPAVKRGEQCAFAADTRPRCVFCPSNLVRCIGGYMTWLIIPMLKEMYPEFVHGLNAEKLAKKLERDSESIGTSKFLEYDGSSHDSHQHITLIEAVDHYVLGRLYEKAFLMSNLPPCLYWLGYRILTTSTWKYVVRYKERIALKQRPACMAKGLICSTVFSGHPSRTTLGNTLRVIGYASYWMHISGVPKTGYRLWVSGDDVLMRINDKYITPKLKEKFEFLYDTKKRVAVHHGLGQSCPDGFKVNERFATFLSKIVIDGFGHIYVNRKEERMIGGGQHSSKVRITRKKRTTMTRKQHAIAITLSLLHYLKDNIFIGWYLTKRIADTGLKLSRRAYSYFMDDYNEKLHHTEYSYKGMEVAMESGRPDFTRLLMANLDVTDPIQSATIIHTGDVRRYYTDQLIVE